MPENMEILDSLIIGRVEPYIYAFSTNTVPDYLKIGDTYRPLKVRLNEWRKYFYDLKEEYRAKAVISDGVFFRDYSVHAYLEELGKERLMPGDIQGVYYSKEFFKDVTIEELDDAIKDIKEKYEKRIDKYQYYNSESRLPETYTYASTGEWKPRPNQQAAIDNFVAAVNHGRKNLLMYAVMRFGKSFTSLCCAKAMEAKTVLVVSAKADVREEWKKTVQQADNFNKDYIFLAGTDLSDNENMIKDTLDSGKGVVVFLTLQDLQGEVIKEKHKEVFKSHIDLLIVDETHYGARAEKYGQVLKDSSYVKDVSEKYADDDYIDYESADEQLKVLDAGVKLHLSGTPYRILMGSEFEKEDIIAFCQFTDIVAEQKKWDEECILSDDVREWDNPYYGFPQMVRFAFNPGKEARAKLEQLKSNGNTYAFSALFRPKSIKKAADDTHREFIYEKEVLDLFEIIDGSREDEELLSFLDYDKIKEGHMCRHMVCVLLYCASCDALEKLLSEHKDKFKNLKDYTIINISGVDRPNEYRSVNAVKEKIAKCEADGQKTITLTVNRMLTGSTVEQWDTMLFFKDTASPQEYDQAIFRLQNQYIKTFVDENGETIKYNMKPQTLLVDFDPHRIFYMQEQKSLIYNANTENGGNQRLEERMREELKISPIITMNKNKIVEVSSSDILSAISDYSKSRGVMDETREIPVDMSLLDIDIILSTIECQAELGAKNGLQIEAHEGEESELDGGDEEGKPDGAGAGEADEAKEASEKNKNIDLPETERQVLENKFRMYYSRLLFYAFLSGDVLKSLEDILASLDKTDNQRIAANLSLDRNVLEAMREHMNPFMLSKLDYKIQNMNVLSRDETIEPTERAVRAINKFGKLSESEVPTPLHAADAMVSLLTDESICRLTQKDMVILDVASKIGEYTIAVYERAVKAGLCPEDIRSSIWSIPTSTVAYEFTRKIYSVLGLDLDCIAVHFTSYDLLGIKVMDEKGCPTDKIDYKKIADILKQKKALSEIRLDDKAEKGDEMKFEAVVGNPPYQVSDGGAQASARPIYHNFIEISKALSPNKISMITPSRWYAGGKGLEEFRSAMLDDKHIEELDDFLHPEEIFPDTNNRGGICYFLWNVDYDNSISGVNIVSHNGDGQIDRCRRSMRTRGLDIFIRDNIAVDVLNKVVNDMTDVMSRHISPRKPFGIESNIVKSDLWKQEKEELKNPLCCYGKGKQEGYIEFSDSISHKEWIDVWKVYTPRANNIGTELNDDNLNTFIGKPQTICTEAYIVIGMDLALDEYSAGNLTKYFKTKFVRFLHGIAKASHDASRKTYCFVPTQDYSAASDIQWNVPIPEIDAQLYAKYGLTQREIDYIDSKIKPMEE